MLPTYISNLEALIDQGTVRRPVNGFFRKRDYTTRELDTLKRLEPDASKAIGRELSNTERDVLLEYKGRLIAAQSRTKTFGTAAGILIGLAIAFNVPRTEMPPLHVRILGDPRMSAFKESIEIRKEEFDGHEPLLVRIWRDLSRTEPPIQWFKAAATRSPSGHSSFRPVVNHPELSWYRAWPSDSDEEQPGDEVSANKKQKIIDPLGRSRSLLEDVRIGMFAHDATDLALKPCMYVS
ncbi:hypothetical protein KCU71_g1708, partial [Aureobasidium melanogenum]